MRNVGMIAAGLMSMWMLVGCGGALEETSEPTGTGDTQALAKAPTDPTGPAPLPYCWNLAGRSCSSPNTTTQCTDGYYTDYTCTCGTDYKYYCMQVR